MERKRRDTHHGKQNKGVEKTAEFDIGRISKKIGVSESTMQRYESSKISKIKYETMESLANLFNVSPEYLMGWSDISDRYEQRFENICKNIQKNDERFRDVITEYYEMPIDYKEKFYEFWELFKRMKE